MFIRNLLLYLLMIPITIFLTSIGWILFFTPYSFRYWWITRWSHCFIFLSKNLCGIKYKVEGRSNIPKENAIVFCNHQSMWETIFLQVLLPAQTWVLKKELLKIPVFGWGLALIEPIAIDRSKTNSIKDLIKQGKRYLAKGRYVIIFPEGTRVKEGDNKKFTRSGAALAEASQYPVLPIVHNAGKIWPRGIFIKRPGTVRVIVGPPIASQDKTTDEINQAAEQYMRSVMQKLHIK